MRFVVILLVLASTSDPLFANIRRSRMRPVPEGQHLKSASQGLIVQSEDLRVNCDQDLCKFEVTYRLLNPAKDIVKIDTTFVAPIEGKINLTCPGVEATESDLKSPGLPVEGRKHTSDDDVIPVLSEAAVACDIPSGESVIGIRYQQLAGLDEEGVGYFSSSWFRRDFLYELAPLKEWQLAKDFMLNLQLTIPDQPIGFFRSMLLMAPVVLCTGDEKNIEPKKSQTKDDLVTISYLWGINFPTRLRCEYQIDDN